MKSKMEKEVWESVLNGRSLETVLLAVNQLRTNRIPCGLLKDSPDGTDDPIERIMSELIDVIPHDELQMYIFKNGVKSIISVYDYKNMFPFVGCLAPGAVFLPEEWEPPTDY